MGFSKALAGVAIFFGLVSSFVAEARTYQIFAYVFDLDDNIVRLPTTIVLFDRKTGAELEVSTARFAEIVAQIGVPGPWENYELRPLDPHTGSFRHFRDDSHPGRFQEDVQRALSGPDFSGKSYSDFLFATSNPLTARRTWINTSRGHESETLSRGTLLLGALHPVPPQNIFAVSHPQNAVLGANLGERKANVVLRLLDELQRESEMARAQGDHLAFPVVNAAGNALEPINLFGFSDDDPKFIETVARAIQSRMKPNAWPDFKIRLIYTGPPQPGLEEGSFVITPGGGRRPQLAVERGEAKRFIRDLLLDFGIPQPGCSGLLVR